jgi:hypothetical protein
MFGVKITKDEAIHFEDLEFATNHSNNLGLSPKEDDFDAVVWGMAHSGPLSLHAILEESSNEDDSASSEGESSGLPVPRACNAVISTVPIATMPSLEEPPMPQTIPARPQWTATPTPLPM